MLSYQLVQRCLGSLRPDMTLLRQRNPKVTEKELIRLLMTVDTSRIEMPVVVAGSVSPPHYIRKKILSIFFRDSVQVLTNLGC